MRTLLVACGMCVASLTVGTGVAQAQWNPMRDIEEVIRRIPEELRPASRFPEPPAAAA